MEPSLVPLKLANGTNIDAAPTTTAPAAVGPAATGPTAQKLIQVAIRSFATRGFDGTSLRDVERGADVNRGLVSYHFGGKDRLTIPVDGGWVLP